MGLEIRGEPGGRRLNTWKEIAAFFGCDERTVKRWESDRGLPVRRLPNGSRSGVFAYEAELREWLDRGGKENSSQTTAAQTVLPAPSKSGRWAFAATALATLGAIAIVVFAATRSGLEFGRRQTAAGSPAASSHMPNATAQTFYRAGLYAWQTRTPVGLTRAVDDFTQAIVHDPQYAEAYAGLASCYNLLREYTTMAPEYAFPRARAAAERAIALNPTLADAHASLAFVDFYWLRDVAIARREFERAIALSPNNATAHHWYATFLMTIGEFPHALSEIDKAETLDTESTAIRADKGYILFYAGRGDEAIALLKQLEQTEPLFASPHHYLSDIYRVRGDDAQFLHELAASANARSDDIAGIIAASGTAGLSAGGHVGMLKAILAAQQRLYAEGKAPAYALAKTYADLEDDGHTLAYVRTSLAHRETDNVTLTTDPEFARLRTNAEFRVLASRSITSTAGTKKPL